jgi:hypothetical protein
MAAKTLLPEAVKAIAEYNLVLAGQHSKNLSKTPVEMQDQCFNAYYVYQVSKQTDYGLVINRWEPSGKQWQLVDFKPSQQVSLSLFNVPARYQKIRTGQ